MGNPRGQHRIFSKPDKFYGSIFQELVAKKLSEVLFILRVMLFLLALLTGASLGFFLAH